MADGADGERAKNWSGTAAPYSRSFAHLCTGTITPLLDAVGEAIGGLDGKNCWMWAAVPEPLRARLPDSVHV
ncbi:hypothetical protein ACW0JT_07535 [Arthrobacter sp. SA17]